MTGEGVVEGGSVGLLGYGEEPVAQVPFLEKELNRVLPLPLNKDKALAGRVK
jgi:hypothetical protein